jgi:hypothetical protein
MRTLIQGLVLVIGLGAATSALAQSKKDDIPAADLPAPVKAVLEQYLKILRSTPDAEAAGKQFVEIAGGGVVNPDGKTLRQDVTRFSLKKDHDNVKFYADPVQITRVNKGASGGQGMGASAIKGPVYKIWIAKKPGGAGLPAPISIMVPEGHATIKDPKVVNIGSL